MNSSAEMNERDVLRVKLEVLRQEHRDLDDAIAALQERGSSDMLTIKRLKKQKLALKDRITQLQDRILPDIIA
ncbi:YdcH family protein [Yoonia sp.]|uniref:YdcH family protein n=1 Tax=Yoonia sp. TaxID=2212373 RepID=UPI0023B4A69A